MEFYELLKLIISLLPLGLIFYFYVHHKYDYWRQRGVRGPRPNFFRFGNLHQTQGRDPIRSEVELLSEYGKVYGIYTGLQPTLSVAEPELIKQVFIKDFPSFASRRELNAYHEMANNSLILSDFDQWKPIRTLSSRSFSSGRLRKYVAQMNQSIDRLDRYLAGLVTRNDGIVEHMKDTLLGLTIEVIAATSFGVQTNSNGDRVQQSPIVKHALNSSVVNPVQAMFYFTMPKWLNALVGVEHIFNRAAVDFFTSTVKSIIAQRREHNRRSADGGRKSNDLVQQLIEASVDEAQMHSEEYDQLTASMDTDFQSNGNGIKSTGRRITLTDIQIVGAGTSVFFAGFDTTALTLTMCLYELAHHQCIQDTLVDTLHAQLDYLDVNADEYLDQCMTKLPLLDAVIKETLRKYPVLNRLERRVTVEKYTLGEITLHRGQIVEIPTVAVHYNPAFYPEPTEFRPDRFLPENKHLLVPYTFLPFGDGPRNCMGMRFAYQQMKLVLSQLLRKYRFTVGPDTPAVLHFSPYKFVLSPQPISLKVELRV